MQIADMQNIWLVDAEGLMHLKHRRFSFEWSELLLRTVRRHYDRGRVKSVSLGDALTRVLAYCDHLLRYIQRVPCREP